MERSEVAEILRGWIADGKLVSKRGTGLRYSEINKRIADKVFLQTSFEGLVATDKDVHKRFEELISDGRVCDATLVKAKKGLVTLYAINLACANGLMLRFSDFGKACPLFID